MAEVDTNRKDVKLVLDDLSTGSRHRREPQASGPHTERRSPSTWQFTDWAMI